MSQSTVPPVRPPAPRSMPTALSPCLAENITTLKSLLQDCDDFIFREFETAAQVQGILVFSTLSADFKVITEVLLPKLYQLNLKPKDDLWAEAIRTVLPFLPEKPLTSWQEIITPLMGGDTLILLGGTQEGYVAATATLKHRVIERPDTEPVIRGPQEGFTEPLSPNLAVIRARMKNPQLKINMFKIGEDSHTNVALIYLEGAIQSQLLADIRSRLASIRMRSVQESGFLSEFIGQKTYTPFPLIQSSERPDKAIAAIVEGRAAILVEGSPFAILVPTTFWHFFQASDDYFQHYLVGSIIRWLRFVAYLLAATFPSLYLSFTVFHPEMLPLRFLFSLSSARENVPLPTILEITMMLAFLDVFREAALRLPRTVGPAIGIVGALILGDAAVSAGIISPIMVIVTALTAISTFAVPTEDLRATVRVFSYFLLFTSSLLGLYGFLLGASVILLHASSLDSLGVPYLSPIGTLHWQEWSDVLFRAPWKVLIHKQQSLTAQRVQQRRKP